VRRSRSRAGTLTPQRLGTVGAARVVRATKQALWRALRDTTKADPPGSPPPGRTFPYFCPPLILGWRARHPRCCAAREFIAHQRSFLCYRHRHLRILSPPRFQGFVLRAGRKSGCGGAGASGAGRWVGGQHPGGASRPLPALSLPTGERASRASSDQLGAGCAAELGFPGLSFCTKSFWQVLG